MLSAGTQQRLVINTTQLATACDNFYSLYPAKTTTNLNPSPNINPNRRPTVYTNNAPFATGNKNTTKWRAVFKDVGDFLRSERR